MALSTSRIVPAYKRSMLQVVSCANDIAVYSDSVTHSLFARIEQAHALGRGTPLA